LNAISLLLRWRTLPVWVYAIALFTGGVIDIGELPGAKSLPSDKILHIACFFGLEVLIEWALPELVGRKRRLLAIGLSVGLGALLELVQAALPYRSAEFLDLAADALGACLGALGVWVLTNALRAPQDHPSGGRP
jgi:VanZ family protein